MGKIVKDLNNIDIELKKFEDKLGQFQNYLQTNSIITEVTKNNAIVIAEESQDMLHKEITMQIKMQDAVLGWLPLLKKLKEDDNVKQEAVRGGAEVGGHFKKETQT